MAGLETRFWEIDFLRGIAILLMIVFHFLFDLNFFLEAGINLSSGFWGYLAVATASIFIILVGMSLTFSFSRARLKGKKKLFSKFLRRGLIIFSWGLIISLITWLFLPKSFVVFGVLHLIGLSIILGYPFLKFKEKNLFLGSMVIALGVYLNSIVIEFPWLFWLGLKAKGFVSVDFFPLLPWFGVILLGIFLGNTLYKGHKRRFKLPDLSKNRFTRFFAFLGKHSLLIYLLHQPALIAVLFLIQAINPL